MVAAIFGAIRELAGPPNRPHDFLHRRIVRYLEDLTVGQSMQMPSIELSLAEILNFASQFDPQPMHTNETAAAAGPLQGLTASGWHTTALAMRLIVGSDPFDGAPVLGLGVDELRWPNPVRPGDVLSGQIEVVSITPSKSKPTHGVVRVHVTVRNQKGEIVLSMFPNLWVPRRAAVTHGGGKTSA